MSHHFHINIYCNNNLQTRIFSPFLERLIFLYKKKKKQFNVKFLIHRLLIKFSIIVHVHPSETIEPVIPSLFSPSWKKSHSLYPLKRERSPNSFCFSRKTLRTEDSKAKCFHDSILPPIRNETIERRNKNLTRSKAKKNAARNVKRGEGWQRGRVYDSRRAKGATAKLVIIRPYFFPREDCGRRWPPLHGPLSDHKETKESFSSFSSSSFFAVATLVSATRKNVGEGKKESFF